MQLNFFNPTYLADLEAAKKSATHKLQIEIIETRMASFIIVRDFLVRLIADPDSFKPYHDNSILSHRKDMIAKELGGLSAQLMYLEFMEGDYSRTSDVMENMSYCDDKAIPLMVLVIKFHLLNLKTTVSYE